MGGARRINPRIINTPEGPKERTRMAGESMRRDQTRRGAFSPMRKRPIKDRDIEARRAERMERREERKQTFGDSFREQRREERMSRRGMDEEALEKRRIFRKLTTKDIKRPTTPSGMRTPTRQKDQNIAEKEI